MQERMRGWRQVWENLLSDWSMLTWEFWILNYDWLTSISSHNNFKKRNILVSCWAVIVNVGWQQNEKSFEQINKGSPVTVMHTMYLTMKGKWEYFLVNTPLNSQVPTSTVQLPLMGVSLEMRALLQLCLWF
jgi:hypothetical protein